MSYDLHLIIDTGGEYPAVLWSQNPTYNLGPMFTHALGGVHIADLNGKTGEELIPIFGEAIKRMRMNPAEYKALNPPNGWGNYEGALETFENALEACTEHPKGIWRAR